MQISKILKHSKSTTKSSMYALHEEADIVHERLTDDGANDGA